MPQKFDLIVIGAGMGGSVLAARCAEAGLATAVLETGRTVTQKKPKPSGFFKKLRRKLADGMAPDPDGERWPDAILRRKRASDSYAEVRPMLGRGPGGSARLYGAALGRARSDDFTQSWNPGDWHPGADDALPNAWPVDYGAFSASYRRAEALMRVCGSRDPLDPADDGRLAPPPAISPAHAQIAQVLETNGRHPFRMHVGIDYRPGCSECQGSSCLRDCKSHGFNRTMQPAIDACQPVTCFEQMSVSAIRRLADDQLEVTMRNAHGAVEVMVAPRVVLAAGALNSPLILRRSAALWDGAVPDTVGAGAMFHYSEIFAVSGMQPGTLYGPRKVLSFRDHYRDGAMPLAECQSMGLVPNAGLIGSHLYNRAIEQGLPQNIVMQLAMRLPAMIGARRFAGAELFTASIEDMPYADNRVEPVIGTDGRDRIGVTYLPRPEMMARVERFRALMVEAFAPLKVTFVSQPGKPNFGHPMGTCRMGADRATSVVDPDCQLWDQPGIYVADASVFPSSLGINPALTVAANALRVADVIIGQAGFDPHQGGGAG